MKEDYVFQWANDGKVGQRVKFSELFGDKNTLLLYSFMFGPNWDKPCPSCTSLVDGFDRTWYQVTRDAAFVAIAKAPAERINAWAKERGWSQIPLLSGFESPFQADYKCQGDSDDMQLPVMHVFTKAGRKDFSFLGNRIDVEPCRHGVAVLEPDGLHAGGPARSDTPPQKFRSEFLEKNYLNKEQKEQTGGPRTDDRDIFPEKFAAQGNVPPFPVGNRKTTSPLQGEVETAVGISQCRLARGPRRRRGMASGGTSEGSSTRRPSGKIRKREKMCTSPSPRRLPSMTYLVPTGTSLGIRAACMTILHRIGNC